MAARQLATTCWSACVSGGGGRGGFGFPGDGINATLATWPPLAAEGLVTCAGGRAKDRLACGAGFSLPVSEEAS